MKQINTFISVLLFLVFNQTQSYSQCAAGPFTVDPASAIILNCPPPTQVTNDFCATMDRFTTLEIPAGTQVCVQFPIDGAFRFETCNLTGDDTFLTIFDSSGNVIVSNDNSCGQQSEIFLNPTTAGDIVCIQVESVNMGICEGINSVSSSYELTAFCFDGASFEQGFSEANLCPSVGFNENQILTSETGLSTDSGFPNVFTFNTGTTSSMGAYTSGSITVCAQGDINASDEIYQINDENGNCVGGVGDVGNQCEPVPFCTSFNFDSAEIAAMVADGTVTFEVFDFDAEIGESCPTNLVSVELNLCAETTVIPTMGEWGLISLGLILLSFSIVAIRQNQYVLN